MAEKEDPPEHDIQALAWTGPQALQRREVLEVAVEEVPHLRDYWQIITKRRWVALTCLLIVFTTVAIGTLKQVPVYAGRVLIEIDPEQPNFLNLKEVLQITTTDFESFDNYRETQSSILKTRPLAERVVRDLQLDLNPEFNGGRGVLTFLGRGPKQSPSRSVKRPPQPREDNFRNAVGHFVDSVDIVPARHSNLVAVSFYSQDPNLAARVANQLASDFIDQNLQVKWDETLKASEWLSGQLVGLKAKLEKSDEALQAYAQAHSILFVEEKKDLGSARLEQLQQEYTKAQADRFEKQSLRSLVEAGKIQDLPGFLSNRLIQDLAVRLAELERDYSQLTAVVKPDYPKALQLKKEVDKVQASLDNHKKALTQNIVDEYRSAVAREKYLAKAVEDQKQAVNQIAEKSIQYNILKREVDTNKQLYEGLLQRLKEAQVSAGLKASNIRVVEPAEIPKSPVRPRVVLNLALGVILGLVVGVGLAFFQEYLDNTLKTPEEVERLVRLPSLGVIPKFSLPSAGKVAGDKLISVVPRRDVALASAIQTSPGAVEAFLSLGTSVLLSPDPAPRTLLITSALPEEGKTTVALNLGATLARLGNSVVVVECDMRRPASHRSLGVGNKPGFVECLTGRVQLPDAIFSVPGVENLSLLPCGLIPTNPAGVLSSRLTAEMLRRLPTEFQYVLVDSPPLLSVADSRILSAMTDAVVLVVRAYRTPFPVVRRASSLLHGVGARILGAVLNDVDFRHDRYSYEYWYGHDDGNREKPPTRKPWMAQTARRAR